MSELTQLSDVLVALSRAVDVLLREQRAVLDALRSSPAGVDRLTDAVRALRDDLAESHERQQREAAALVQRVATATTPPPVDLTPVLDQLAWLAQRQPPAVDLAPVLDQLSRLSQPQPQPAPPEVDLSPVLDELARLRAVAERPAPTAPAVDLQPVLDQLAAAQQQQPTQPEAPEAIADELRRLRQDLDERLNGIYDRLGGVEWRMGERLDPLVHRVDALERLATDLARQDDVRRATDRIVGEVKAVDDRFGAIADDLRVIKLVRDGLQSLTDGIDGVRQLTAKTASSQQLAELSRELGAVLGEIAAARNQVLRVEQDRDVIAVGHDVERLGERIERLADAVEAQGTAPPQVSQRLRKMSTAARQLGNGVLEDLRRGRHHQ